MRTLNAANVLLTQMGYASVPIEASEKPADNTQLGTVLASMAYYGYAPSVTMMDRMRRLSVEVLADFWRALDPLLAEITADNRDISDFVVYKNFPREVLEMSEAEYWVRQIIMYIGFPNELVTEVAEDREPLTEKLDLKTLEVSPSDPATMMIDYLVAKRTEMTPREISACHALLENCDQRTFDLSEFGFRANGARFAAYLIDHGEGHRVRTSSATDVLRIALVLSDMDPMMRTKPWFSPFTRAERRSLFAFLEGCSDLVEDFARNREVWKRLLSRLHPGDYNVPRVQAAYNELYNGATERFNARLERGFANEDEGVLELLKTRPGMFMRALNQAYKVFGFKAVVAFKGILHELTVDQLLRTVRYLECRDNQLRLIRPSGNWEKSQVIAKTVHFDADAATGLARDLRAEVARRMNAALPEGVDLDPEVITVNLPSNGQEIDVGRGTEIDLGDDVRFIRSASYWKMPGHGNVYFDNGWNFFQADWRPMGAVCWNTEQFPFRKCEKNRVGAIFSGDPTVSKDMEGRGAQMIDLYLDNLAEQGVAYAVWSIMCFSKKSFNQAEDVVATLQTGVEPQEGKLYEPGRAQISLPVKGDNMTKFMAYIDVARRKLIVMDCALPAVVESANAIPTRKSLQDRMPAFMAYADMQPSIADLFEGVKAGSIPVRKSDKEMAVVGKGYVFKSVNPESKIDAFDLEALLALKGDVAEEAVTAA